jgi:hypothetical protein
MKAEQRNFATHPRTIRESFHLIVAAYVKGRLTQGVICSGYNYCAFGACLTVKQRNYFRNSPDAGAPTLRAVIGSKNMKAMTGMSHKQVAAIIEANDGHLSCSIIDAVRSGLKNGSVEIDGVSFRLGKAK